MFAMQSSLQSSLQSSYSSLIEASPAPATSGSCTQYESHATSLTEKPQEGEGGPSSDLAFSRRVFRTVPCPWFRPLHSPHRPVRNGGAWLTGLEICWTREPEPLWKGPMRRYYVPGSFINEMSPTAPAPKQWLLHWRFIGNAHDIQWASREQTSTGDVLTQPSRLFAMKKMTPSCLLLPQEQIAGALTGLLRLLLTS